tara:strand:- start:274492 stop:274689 length:198 start_codon:yes stop_codon:yes gene_type:complete
MEMNYIFLILALIFVGLTVLSFVGGLTVMGKGGDKSASQSNKFMQMRILFQALALGCLALSIVTG